MDSAQVQSIEALRDFRVRLCKFAETAGCVLSDADSELQRTLNWLQTEQPAYWKAQIHKRAELVVRAKESLRAKRMLRNVDGTRPSALDEEKALRLAIQRLEEAEGKLATVRRDTQRLQKELLLYKGQVQRFANLVAADLPAALAQLGSLIGSLEAYLATGPEQAGEEPVPGLIEGQARPMTPPEPQAEGLGQGPAAKAPDGEADRKRPREGQA